MKRINQLLLLIVLFFWSIFQSFGCSCAPVLLETEIKETPIIFTGRAINIEPFKVTSGGFEQEFLRTTFEIIELLKGESTGNLAIITDPYGSSCGYSFDQDSVYLVFGNHAYYRDVFDEDEITTGLCTRTRALTRSSHLIRKLKKLGSQINSIESIEPSILYGHIWSGEKFIWTDEHPQLLLTEAEQFQLIQANLVYCETDSIFPQNDMDSIMLDMAAWNFKPTKVTVVFEVDEFGGTSNFDVWPFGNTDGQCQELAIEFVRNLKSWKPASIKNIDVRSSKFYQVDFAQCKIANSR